MSDNFLKYKRFLVRYGVPVHDLLLAPLSLLGAYAIALGFPDLFEVPDLLQRTAFFTGICAICLFLFSVRHGSWRYVSIPELLSIIKAAAAAVAIYTIGAFLLSRGTNVPRSVPILTTLFLIAGLSATRLTYRLVMDGLSPQLLVGIKPRASAGRNVLVYGLTDEAEGFIRTTQRSRGEISVLGIIDNEHVSKSVQGVPVLGKLRDLESHVARFAHNGVKLTELVVAQPNVGRQQLGELLELVNTAGLRLTRLPTMTETSSITSSLPFDPKPIELGDLLGRPEVQADIEGVARLVHGKVILATGAGGSIGSELCRQIATFGPKQLIITDSSEFHIYLLDKELREAHPQLPIVTRIVDVRDRGRVSILFGEFRPQVVFHAAALKHVPLVEENPLEGIKTNVLGTRNIADAAVANHTATFVMISTDKAVNPTNVMGATKRAAETYCQSLDVTSKKTRFKTVRFGNVLGSNGSVVPRFTEQIAAGGPVTVTHPHIVRYFMTIPEAVRLVLHASARALARQSERGKIMVLDMGKPVKIVDLAERMIQLAGFKPRIDIDIVFTGLRPGEKLYEELFDPSEVQDAKTDEGYVVAAPRIIDKALLDRALSGLEGAVAQEDGARAVELLAHIVPEYRKDAHRPPAEAVDASPLGQKI